MAKMMLSTSEKEMEKEIFHYPTWESLNSLEQTVFVVFSQQKAAQSWWDLYNMETRLWAKAFASSTYKAFEKMQKMGVNPADAGLMGRLKYFRGEGIEFPSQRTFKKLIEEFAQVGWIGLRDTGKKKYYFANHAVIEKLKPGIAMWLDEYELNESDVI